MAYISINEAKTGMVLKSDVISMKSGAMLLASGTVLNEANILHMKSNGIVQVEILEKADAKEEIVYVEDNIFHRSYEQLTSKTKQTLNNIKLGKKIIVKEVSEVVDDIIDELMKNNNILGRLRRIQESDDYIYKHSLHVCMIATMVGKWLNYNSRELKQLSLCGLFHDIGKLKISDDIINKPGKLTEKEFNIVKKHTVYGYTILDKTVGLSKNVAIGALQHHEREDGSGYPFKLKSDKIHEFAKIIAVCDIFDAMTSDRVYKHKESPFKVAELINENCFGVLDPRISLVFLKNISKFYIGNIIKLNNNSIGEIVYVHKDVPTRPIVKVGDKFIDLLKETELEIIDIIN